MKVSVISLLAVSSAATAASLTKVQRQDSLLWPYATYRYWVNSGQWKEDPQDQLLVVKNGVLADETTTIVTFDIPADVAGRTCKLVFDLWDRDVSTGTQQADVFTATKPTGAERAAVSVETVSKQTAEFVVQSRDKHVGRIRVTAPGTANWIQSYQGYPEFECPAGQMVGFEFVGAGDNMSLRWDIGVTGPRVQVV
ncbi:hypothetical protein ATEIFO6365_0015005500 [Aspergillus terreus]|uniref:Uncharacterized protein n=1 Tax=Aspergillus terreus TaxID=33178 RepID=A0A5M3ZD14_ASPTE|nr:hypothetical protein ATETN484_0016005500 [Aspergillus terreus]GFF21484.1 hypothetical protein ATEIFO6365_0015005500 [Aspergillus terreus]